MLGVKFSHCGLLLAGGLFLTGCAAVAPAPLPPPVTHIHQEQVQFHLKNLPSLAHHTADFQSAAVPLSQIRYLRLWVRGSGIPDRIWNENGYVPVTLNPTGTLTVKGIPKGKNRLVIAQGYNSAQQPIDGATLMAYYHSPADTRVVTVTLTWRHIPTVRILERLLDMGTSVWLDGAQLQVFIDQLLYANQSPGPVFAVHPTRINVAAIAQYVATHGGELPTAATPGLTLVVPTQAVPFNVRNAQNQPPNLNVTLSVNDPASSPLTLAGGGSGNTTLNAIALGNWQATASMAGLGAAVTAQASVQVQEDGTVVQSAGTVGNPLLLPPVIATVNVPPPANGWPNPLAWWRGEGLAQDAVRGHHLTAMNTPGYAAGLSGQAFQLDGVNDYLYVPNQAAFDVPPSASLTLTTWFKTTGTPNPFQYLFDRYGNTAAGCAGGGAAATSAWYELVMKNNGQLLFAVRDDAANGGSGQEQILTTAGSYADNLWHHVAAVINRTNNTLQLYVDGTLNLEQPLIPTAALTFDEPLYIGARCGPGGEGTHSYFSGQLDEPQVFAKALSASEMADLYQARTVTLTGDGFGTTPANNTLAVGATVLSSSMTTLKAMLAPTLWGTPQLSLNTAGQTSNPVTVQARPNLGAVYPDTGLSGNSVTLLGSGFDPVFANNTVTFNGLPATVTGGSQTTLTVTVPDGGVSGAVAVQNSGGMSTGPSFTALGQLTGLVSWWRGENTPQDTVGTNPGTLVANTTFAPGKVGNAFSFDGIQDYVHMDDHPSLDFTADMSTLAWVRKTGPWVQSHPMIVAKEPINSAYILWLNSDGVPLENSDFAVRMLIGGGLYTCRSGVIPATGTWYHVAGVRQGTSLRIYVNGQLKNNCVVSAGAIGTTNGELAISAAQSSTDEFNGLIDEVQLFNRGLATHEVQMIYDATK